MFDPPSPDYPTKQRIAQWHKHLLRKFILRTFSVIPLLPCLPNTCSLSEARPTGSLQKAFHHPTSGITFLILISAKPFGKLFCFKTYCS